MYLFIHYICFYSNIFGYETKVLPSPSFIHFLTVCFLYRASLFVLQKIIPFADISCVKRAKTAGIFPNAIEILAGGKKVGSLSSPLYSLFLVSPLPDLIFPLSVLFCILSFPWWSFQAYPWWMGWIWLCCQIPSPDSGSQTTLGKYTAACCFFILIFLTLTVQDSFSESNNQVNDGVVQSTLDLASELDSPSRYFVSSIWFAWLLLLTNCFMPHYPSLHRDETPRLSGSSSVPVITQNGVSPSSVNLQRHTEPLVDSVASSSTNILNSKPEDLNAPKCS